MAVQYAAWQCSMPLQSHSGRHGTRQWLMAEGAGVAASVAVTSMRSCKRHTPRQCAVAGHPYVLQAAPQHLETQLAAAEVYGRKAKPLLEAAAVKRAVELAGREHPDVHRALVKFGQRGERWRLVRSCLCCQRAAGSRPASRAGWVLQAPCTTACAVAGCPWCCTATVN